MMPEEILPPQDADAVPSNAPVTEVLAEEAAAPKEEETDPIVITEPKAKKAVESPLPAADPEPDAPKAAPAKKPRRKPHIALRIPLQLLSFLLSLVLFVAVIAGVLLLDLRQLTSAGGIQLLINAVITSTTNAPATIVPTPQYEPIHILPMDNDSTGETGTTLPNMDGIAGEDGSIDPGDVGVDLGAIPEDVLTGGDVGSLTDWIYKQLEEASEEALPFTREEIGSFVEKSTVSEFLGEKLAEYADDFINGTENASITVDELMALVEENEALLKSELNIELNSEWRQRISETFEEMVIQSDLSSTIRDSVYEAVDQILEESSDLLGGLDRQDIQHILAFLTSDMLFYVALGAAALLLLLLCLLNFYNVPAGLTWASLPCISAGLILSLPIILLQNSSALIEEMIPEIAPVLGVLASFVTVLAPIHYGLLYTGLGLLVISIVWRIIRGAVRQRRLAAA